MKTETVRAFLRADDLMVALCEYVVRRKRPFYSGHFSGLIIFLNGPRAFPEARVEVRLDEEESE